MSQLTPAEIEVVRAIAAGSSQARVARQRGTSRQTVANQVASAFRKLGIGSRRELQRLMAAPAPAQ
jgi:DNA-binding CsgD family transcriptional regulator